MVKPEHSKLYELVQKQTGIIKLISSYIPLSESRRGMKGNCPFHDDQSKSLMISPEKNIFKCFGCGLEGGPVEFVISMEKVTHEYAMTILSAKLNSLKSA